MQQVNYIVSVIAASETGEVTDRTDTTSRLLNRGFRKQNQSVPHRSIETKAYNVIENVKTHPLHYLT